MCTCFLAFFGDILSALSSFSPLLPPTLPLAAPSRPLSLPAPDEFLLLPGVRAGRLLCGWRDWPWQLCRSQGGETWVPSQPLTHCRGNHIPPRELK